MTEQIRRPVSQLRAGDLIALADEGPVFAVCAISAPLGTGRRVELVNARTGADARSVRLSLREAVITVAGKAGWHVVTNHANGSTETVIAASGFAIPVDGPWTLATWPAEIDSIGRPGWEQLRRGLQAPAAKAA